jgi:hypothetical protein
VELELREDESYEAWRGALPGPLQGGPSALSAGPQTHPVICHGYPPQEQAVLTAVRRVRLERQQSRLRDRNATRRGDDAAILATTPWVREGRVWQPATPLRPRSWVLLSGSTTAATASPAGSHNAGRSLPARQRSWGTL